MLHHTKQQVFRPSACKQTAVGVLEHSQCSLVCVSYPGWSGSCTVALGCSMHKAATHPTGRYPSLPQTIEF